ncbi:MAG: alanine racemase C-terminal domain-containing protein, partial [Bacteroidota bacterium]
DMVRAGIALYGFAGGGIALQLDEVMSLRTTIAQIKKLMPGDTVGYNRKGKITRPTVIATIRVGYADGYPRQLSNGKGKMLVHGKEVPVIGNVCMDMTMLDITDVPGVKEGDKVVVFGKDRSLSMLASEANTIPYEIMTGISQRVKRVYIEE